MTVTPGDIRGITGSAVEDSSITPFIKAAGCMMEQIATCIVEFSDDCKDQIQTYLAAHLLVSSNVGKDSAPLKREMLLNEYEVEYIVSKGGTGLLSTPFGETANMLSGGCLANLDKQPPSFHGLGSI
jgi:hypothetical protein